MALTQGLRKTFRIAQTVLGRVGWGGGGFGVKGGARLWPMETTSLASARASQSSQSRVTSAPVLEGPPLLALSMPALTARPYRRVVSIPIASAASATPSVSVTTT